MPNLNWLAVSVVLNVVIVANGWTLIALALTR